MRFKLYHGFLQMINGEKWFLQTERNGVTLRFTFCMCVRACVRAHSIVCSA